jgi:anti-anti-sigma factor
MSETLIVPNAISKRADSQPDEFVCQLSDDGLGVARVYVAAELDIASAPHLERALRRAELRARLVVLDLRELTFMDSCGSRVIVYASNRAQRAGRRLVLVRGPSQVQRLLALSGAAERVEIVELTDSEPAIQASLQIARADEGAGLPSGIGRESLS